MRKLIFIISFLISSASPTFAESSKEILTKALSVSNSINQNLTIEQKLSKYEQIQSLIDKILSQHAGTDESIKILSGQKIGTFNYSSIQNNYLKELTGYYETVCGVSPSFKCIAFVSLNQGVNSCKNSKTFQQLDLSHKDIKNALNIFVSQDAKKNYKSLALNSYRNCLSNSKVKRTQSIQDYFSSKLVPMFLMLNQKEEAKAVIQQLKDPYLKFAGVIEVSKSENNGISLEYFTRMREYIDNRLSYENYPYSESEKWKKSQNLALLKLKSEMLRHSKFPIEEDRDLHYQIGWGLDDSDIDNGDLSCSISYNKSYFDGVVDLLDISILKSKEVVPEVKEFRGMQVSNEKGRKYNLNRIMHSMRFDQRKNYFDKCANQTDNKDYAKAINIYSRIGMYDYKEGKKFLNNAALSNYNSNQMMEYYFIFERQNPGLSKVSSTANPLTRKKRRFNSQPSVYDDFYGFKKYVVNDKMCEAIDVLFKKFKGTKNYSRAISYLIDSPDVDRNKKYDCGDETLEMLLN